LGLVRYFERWLAKEARFHAVWIERDIQPAPYLSGWRLCHVRGKALYGEQRAILGGMGLTGEPRVSSGAANTKAEAQAMLVNAVAELQRFGYREVRSAAKRVFRGFPVKGVKRKYRLAKKLERR
jgi:hypothetical protein